MNFWEIYEVTLIQEENLNIERLLSSKKMFCTCVLSTQVQAFQFVAVLYVIITAGDLLVSQ